MKPNEKRALVLEPIMNQYASKEWIMKRDSLWRICHKEGFALQITPELSSVGDLHYICVSYGSFYSGIKCGRNLVPYMCDMVVLSSEMRSWEYSDHIVDLCRLQAELYVSCFNRSPFKDLFSAQSYEHFLHWSHIVKEDNPGFPVSACRAWDLLACQGQEKALLFLEEGLAAMKCWKPLPNKLIDRYTAVQITIQSIAPTETNQILAERYSASENILASYFGKRRWHQLVDDD